MITDESFFLQGIRVRGDEHIVQGSAQCLEII